LPSRRFRQVQPIAQDAAKRRESFSVHPAAHYAVPGGCRTKLTSPRRIGSACPSLFRTAHNRFHRSVERACMVHAAGPEYHRITNPRGPLSPKGGEVRQRHGNFPDTSKLPGNHASDKAANSSSAPNKPPMRQPKSPSSAGPRAGDDIGGQSRTATASRLFPPSASPLQPDTYQLLPFSRGTSIRPFSEELLSIPPRPFVAPPRSTLLASQPSNRQPGSKAHSAAAVLQNVDHLQNGALRLAAAGDPSPLARPRPGRLVNKAG